MNAYLEWAAVTFSKHVYRSEPFTVWLFSIQNFVSELLCKIYLSHVQVGPKTGLLCPPCSWVNAVLPCFWVSASAYMQLLSNCLSLVNLQVCGARWRSCYTQGSYTRHCLQSELQTADYLFRWIGSCHTVWDNMMMMIMMMMVVVVMRRIGWWWRRLICLV